MFVRAPILAAAAIAALAANVVAVAPAFAQQDWPTRPVTVEG